MNCRIKNPTSIALLVLLLCTECLYRDAWAKDFQTGLAATQTGDYVLAARIWYPLAERGEADAQFGLGTLFHEGLGVEQDLTESSYWFHRAAEQGLAQAQYNLGNAYKNGDGVGQSDRMAVHWWRKSARQSFAPAQFNLGTALRYGRGVQQDTDDALTWYRQAAALGHPMAVETLARDPDLSAVSEEDPPPPRADSTRQGLDCTDWLAAQAATRYTIQFMASAQTESAAHYVERHAAAGPFIICAYPRGERQWYAVLWGSFADRAGAQAALSGLPAAMQSPAPWIRSIRSVRKLRHAPKPP